MADKSTGKVQANKSSKQTNNNNSPIKGQHNIDSVKKTKTGSPQGPKITSPSTTITIDANHFNKLKGNLPSNFKSTPPIQSPGLANVSESDVSQTSDKWMERHLSWLENLRDPFGSAGVRIPVPAPSQTGTLQVVQRAILQTDSSTGISGILLGTAGINSSTGIYMVPQNAITTNLHGDTVAAAVYMLTNNVSTTNQIFFDGNTAGTGSTPVAISGLGTFFSSYCSRARVVSCGINIQPAVSVTSANGYYVGGSLPPNFLQNATFGSANMSSTALMTYPGAIVTPVYNPKAPGITVTHTPADMSCLNFISTGRTSLAPTDPEWNSANPSMMYAFVVGDVSKQHLLTLVINYEYTLKSGVLSIGTAPSFSDPLALAVTTNARQRDPLVFAGSDLVSHSVGTYNTGSGNDLFKTQRYLFKEDVTTTPPLKLENSSEDEIEEGNKQGMNGFHLPEMWVFPKVTRIIRNRKIGTAKGFYGTVPCVTTNNSKATKVLTEEVEERPLFESLVDTLGGIVKKGLPKLLPFLNSL